ICWDRFKKDVWVRQPPSFAIRSHPLLKPRKDAYQDFLPRTCADGITIVGIRTAESIQRLQNIATMLKAGKTMTNKHQVFPIYDWTDNDVWKYLSQEHLDIPEIYLFLWQSGTNKRQLRVSQFFSVDTAKSLVKMNEYYPDLMERIIRREPNAYLAALYWDSEMFGRSTAARRKNEAGETEKDYKAALLELFSDMDGNFNTPHKRYVAERYRNFFMSAATIADQKDYKAIYEGLISGDPKFRTFRALYQRIYGKYINGAKQKEGSKHG
ncbi:MAG: phosphoadenosine phosphosulfate reductase family protein, partial [Lachnospiraceae bacterium]|nr:phosphoadenosine phosphosulfate reductase family protein [Lachnospiraceae bacterium]